MLIIRNEQKNELFAAIRKRRQDLQVLVLRIIARLSAIKVLSLPDLAPRGEVQARSETDNLISILKLNAICLSVCRDVLLAGRYGLYKEDSLAQFAGYRFLLGSGWLEIGAVKSILDKKGLTEYEKTTDLALTIESTLD